MIKHVQQNNNTCVIACIAMVANLTHEEVLQSYPEFNGEGICVEDTLVILRRLKIPYIQYVSTCLYESRVFLITVRIWKHND